MLNDVYITDIKKTKRGYNAIFSQNGFEVSVDDVIVEQYNIEIGSCLSRREFVCIKQQSANQKREDKCFTLLSYRMHSEKELRDKLLKYFDSYTADCAVERMRELGYLDDEKFAFSKRDYLINVKKHSLKDTAMRLSALGVDKNTIDNVILNFYNGSESDVIKELIYKKYMSRLSRPEKVIASLVRKGFPLGEVKKAVYGILENIQEE